MSLRQAVTAGEQLQITPAIAQFFRQLPDCTLHNQYGPSESHVVAAYALTGSPENWSLLPPIGRAIANVKLYLLDSNLQPVPIGVPGELYIGGTMLARGYLNRPDLTAERFIADPFVAGETLYRTGDLARYDSDGNLHYLGRADRQVKLRGFRVELGEIEAVLAQHPGVREVAVVMRDRRLIAYVVPQSSDANEGEWRTFLTERLPDYMVPSIWMTLEALPLTPSGKVDRRSLPVPKGDRPSLATSYVAPRTDLERWVARIWREVLQVEKVGIYDNFFDLGGHSLLTVQLGDRLQSELERSIPLTDLFQYPTVAALANYLNCQNSAESETKTVRDRGKSRRENLRRQRQRRR
jgi:acyl carrier protein